MADSQDRVHIIEYREDGLLVAQYGEGKRSPHVCCPYCTSDEQIIPVLKHNGMLICPDCGFAVLQEVEVPEYFLFTVNDGKPHITLEKEELPTAITGREFNASDEVKFVDVDSIDPDEVCAVCRKRFEEDYGGL